MQAAARRAPWTPIYFVTAVVLLAVLGFLIWAAPRDEGGAILWTEPMIKAGWMAWTLATALFFYIIGAILVAMTLIAARFRETPRVGLLRIETTRGDRLFISLLGSAFICLAWLGLVSDSLWGGLVVCLIYAAAVFRWV
jgi:predicted small integral membrane protein